VYTLSPRELMSLQAWFSRRSVKRHAVRASGVALLAVAGGLLVLLKALPYSSVRVAGVDAKEATLRPEPNFSIGPLHWPVRELAIAPELEPFREAMRSYCGDRKGIAAAECASELLSERVPVGTPSTEFVRSDFNPVAHFKEHMSGAPGHCLTRSAILAAELLSVGIPARVVQFVPVEEKGHTLVEVWDDGGGWTVVDPSTSGILIGSKSPADSAVELLAEPSMAEWRGFGHASKLGADGAETGRFRALLQGDVIYPEPWLYLRVGERVAPWPFRGEYARIGRAYPTLGPLQQLLFWVIPGVALAGLVLLVVGHRRLLPFGEAAWEEALRRDVAAGIRRPTPELEP
jgi:hypothetical protein